MTLDEMEKLCRDEIADPVTGTKQRDYRGSMRAYNLARAFLDVLPVLRAAETWAETEALDITFGPFARDHLASIDRLKTAIDTMRATLGRE